MIKVNCILVLCIMGTCYGNLLQHSVLICGVARDVEHRVSHSIKIMETIGRLFSKYHILVYENNSIDNTPNILKKWQKTSVNVTVISEYLTKEQLDTAIINRSKNNHHWRPEKIARARNIVLQKAMSEEYSDYDYIIWMDMDFKLEPNYEGFIEVFTTKQEWDAVFAYGIDPKSMYWDWYALRTPTMPLGSELLGDTWWHLEKRLTLKNCDDWYPVYSAFGGCGIYKKSSLQGCSYSALVTPDLAKFYQYIFEEHSYNQMICQYTNDLNIVNQIITITEIHSEMPHIKDIQTGILIPNIHERIVWRMSSDAFQYPSVCEHVPLHASMIVRGHNKLFINPRLIFRYSS